VLVGLFDSTTGPIGIIFSSPTILFNTYIYQLQRPHSQINEYQTNAPLILPTLESETSLRSFIIIDRKQKWRSSGTVRDHHRPRYFNDSNATSSPAAITSFSRDLSLRWKVIVLLSFINGVSTFFTILGSIKCVIFSSFEFLVLYYYFELNWKLVNLNGWITTCS